MFYDSYDNMSNEKFRNWGIDDTSSRTPGLAIRTGNISYIYIFNDEYKMKIYKTISHIDEEIYDYSLCLKDGEVHLLELIFPEVGEQEFIIVSMVKWTNAKVEKLIVQNRIDDLYAAISTYYRKVYAYTELVDVPRIEFTGKFTPPFAQTDSKE
jgi:hypothetical protein